MQYFRDRFVRKEIECLDTICPFSEMGCTWEGKFKQYLEHVEVCDFRNGVEKQPPQIDTPIRYV